ncbi:MAG: hypothetical protein VX498_10940 [Myxococcota bacterium]|nr:hypothetical protein [Myxococcota bacterium]
MRRLWVATILASMVLVPAGLQADDEAAPMIRKVAGGLHNGHLFGPRLRPNGAAVAYGVREETKGTFKTSYYARDLESGIFHSVWPKQHPSFSGDEGTASFTDLVDFEWLPGGRYNAMVVKHKTKGLEVLLETISVRFTGMGDQAQPAVAPDGTRLVVVSGTDDGSGTELWISDTTDNTEPLQLTFTDETEAAPEWHPEKPQIIHELRNPLGSDIYVFDLDTFEQRPLVRAGTSDEVLPSFSPDGLRFAYLSNKDSDDGLRWDLFVRSPTDSLPKLVARNIRRSEKSRGYSWDPSGRFIVAVQNDEAAGYPIIIAPSDGSGEAKVLFDTKDNMDPTMIAMGEKVRMAWVAMDMSQPEEKRFRVVYVADFDPAQLGGLAGARESESPGGKVGG